MYISEEMKKVMLLGIGAVSTTAEKSKELLDSLVEKGELTIEQGKAINEEIKKKFKEKDSAFRQDLIASIIDNLSPEELEILKTRIEKLENNQTKAGGDKKAQK